MNPQTAIDGALVFVLLLNLALLSAGRLATCVRIFAFESLVISFLPVVSEWEHGAALSPHGFILLAITIGLKVIVIPWFLLRILRTGEIHREVEPFIGFAASVVIGALMIVASFIVATRLSLPGVAMSSFLVPVAMSTVLIGLLILVSRIKAINQVIGYLVLENGIFLFGLLLLHEMPLMVELGILLDVFVGVFVMAIVVYHIRREFDHMDTNILDHVKESE